MCHMYDTVIAQRHDALDEIVVLSSADVTVLVRYCQAQYGDVCQTRVVGAGCTVVIL